MTKPEKPKDTKEASQTEDNQLTPFERLFKEWKSSTNPFSLLEDLRKKALKKGGLKNPKILRFRVEGDELRLENDQDRAEYLEVE
ncbi:MAG: hypothetical protein VKK42_19620 [Lyngbya sp.]|nr:hypothetical protein [Lyngbya sp.]